MPSFDLNEECQAVHAQLLGAWLGDVDEHASSSLLDHLSTCRSCLKSWIAIQAAADLALVSGPLGPDDEPCADRWRPTDLPATDGTWQSLP